MPFSRSLERIPNREFWGKWFGRDYQAMIPERRLEIFHPLNFYELASSWLGFLPEPFAFSARAFSHLATRLRGGERWDLVHDVQCLGWGLLGLRALGLPIVTTVHHPLTVDRRASFIRDENLREAIGSMQFYPIGMQSTVARHIDRVLTSSEESARTIVRDFGVAPDRIRNVRNGLDTELFSPDPDVSRDENELLCVGRASDPNKGIRTLIQALARTPSELHLTLVDSDHPGNEVFKWAREAGVEKRLEVTGRVPQDELVHLYRRAGVVVVPSRYEGFGLPAVEALACETPVVACRAGALPEVMTLCAGGEVVERDDPDALAAGIRRLHEAKESRRAMARAARRRVVQHLSWKTVAEATADVYAEVLEERRGRPTTTITSARVGQA
jgi:glycosyltransferase involved in cell wall biosynthesis